MSAKITEHLHECAKGLDQRPMPEIAALIVDGQLNAVAAVQNAIEDICAGAATMAQSIRDGGCIHYIAAGSSGLMAAADAQELGGTFSIPAKQLCILMAGGLPTGVEMPGDTEDDTKGLKHALANLSGRDTVIAVSASGSTPYTLAAAQIANTCGAALIGIANNEGARLLEMADHSIFLKTPPEVLSGSTRMGAGTAQKIALNTLSTLMAIDLGHVHDGMMVNLFADNIKLRNRAKGIVGQIAQVSPKAASDALDAAGGHIKPAVLIAKLGVSHDAAIARLTQTDGHLRPALEQPT
ncbi:MAG: N-acetylmuramic acid 6-phosphate etherase [Paracoccaceae bacterium]